MSVFTDLLSIKRFREGKAELAVRGQRSVLAASTLQRDRAVKALQQFRDDALRHERALYADLCVRIVKLRDIEQVQRAVVDLRDQERHHEVVQQEAEQDRLHQAERLEVEKRQHEEACRIKEKFVELAQAFAEERDKELARREDAELEEIAELRRERADWDEFHDEEGP